MARVKKSKKKSVSRVQAVRDWFFAAPYYGVPWLVWFYALISCLIMNQGGVFTGHMFGFDDQVRMTQVMNWINGADWYDRTIMRANPPDGFHSIWTRIVDIPIAIVVLIAQQFTEQRTAALIAAFIVPMAQLAVLFAALRYFARPLVGKHKARLIVLFVMFTTVMNFKHYTFSGFHPGEASHHSWYVILNVLMFGALARIALGVRGFAPPFMFASAIALLLAVGIEGFPMIAGAAAIFAFIAWYFQSPFIATRGAMATGMGAIFTLLLLPMNQPPFHLLDVSFAEPSILGPVLVGSAAAFLTIEAKLLKLMAKGKYTCLICLAIIAALFSFILISLFPQILDGAAAALSPEERAMAFNEHPEAWPLFAVADSTLDLIGLLAPLVIAFIAAVIALRNAKTRRQKILHMSYFGAALVAAGMSQIFWRYYHHALMTSCVWLLWLWEKIKTYLNSKTFIFIAFVLLGPLWMLLLPAYQYNDSLKNILFYPARLQTFRMPCDERPLAQYLNANYDKGTILNVLDQDSAKFLFQSDLVIDFVANFPSQNKFIDNKTFFLTSDIPVAREIARRHGIDLVAVCAAQPYPLQSGPSLITLLQNEQPPNWLKFVKTGVPGNYVLYEVVKTKLSPK